MKKREVATIATILVMVTIISISVFSFIFGIKREISYTLTYTLYGEEKILTGKAICEFDCIGFSTNDGFKPRYCIYLEGQVEKDSSLGITVLDLRGKEEPENFRNYVYRTAFPGERLTGVSFSGGSAKGYMKQEKGHGIRYNLDLSVDYEIEMPTGGKGTGGYYIAPDAAEAVFGIRLISFVYDIK